MDDGGLTGYIVHSLNLRGWKCPFLTLNAHCFSPYGLAIVCIYLQAKCIETGETVAIKKVLQDKRYKNRELQIMRLLDHPNIVALKHCFFSTTDKDELYLNLVLEYVPETVYRIAKHYNRMNQRMPLVYVKLYTYQVCSPQDGLAVLFPFVSPVGALNASFSTRQLTGYRVSRGLSVCLALLSQSVFWSLSVHNRKAFPPVMLRS